MTDHILDFLGDYFVEKQLIKKGWKFHEFVDAWKQGNIVFEIK